LTARLEGLIDVEGPAFSEILHGLWQGRHPRSLPIVPICLDGFDKVARHQERPSRSRRLA
jgi:hypothetical protein